eukprot:5584829-Amphidinium_carterae.2
MEQAVEKVTSLMADILMALGQQTAKIQQLSAQIQAQKQTLQTVATVAASSSTYPTRGVIDGETRTVEKKQRINDQRVVKMVLKDYTLVRIAVREWSISSGLGPRLQRTHHRCRILMP